MGEGYARAGKRGDNTAAPARNIQLGYDGALYTGIGKSACGIGEVFRVAFCRDDQNRFCINDRNEVLEARHVLLVERNDGGKVDHAALAIFAGGAQHVEQVIGGACNANLVLIQFQIGGKLCATGCGVEIGRDRQNARVGDGGAAPELEAPLLLPAPSSPSPPQEKEPPPLKPPW